MKKPKNQGRKQGPEPPKIIRHYETLTPRETDELVDAVAKLIVNFVQQEGLDLLKSNPAEAWEIGAEKSAPGEPQRNPAMREEQSTRGKGLKAVSLWPG